MKRTSRLIAPAVLIIGTAFAQDEADAPKPVDVDAKGEPPSQEACFNVREVEDFSALDDLHVYLEGRRSDQHYLLTMFQGCVGLRGAIGIAISNEISRVCSNDNARVTYRGFGRVETCPIEKVEAVEDRESAEALATVRSK